MNTPYNKIFSILAREGKTEYYRVGLPNIALLAHGTAKPLAMHVIANFFTTRHCSLVGGFLLQKAIGQTIAAFTLSSAEALFNKLTANVLGCFFSKPSRRLNVVLMLNLAKRINKIKPGILKISKQETTFFGRKIFFTHG